MANTVIGVNDAQAIRTYATRLATDWKKMLYWDRFMGDGPNNIVEEKTDLESAAGDKIQFDLNMRLQGAPVYGDDTAEGKEQSLRFLVDEVKIDQVRKPTDGGGRMTRQRTLHNIRKLMKERTAEYLAEWQDEVMFVYASGDFGNTAMNEDAVFTDPSFAGNDVESPDSSHITYGGAATGKADLATTDVMSTMVIERTATKVSMLNATNRDVVNMKPVRIDGDLHFVLTMSPYQKHSLRTGAASTDWMEIQKLAGVRGGKNNIFRGSLGMFNNVVLHEHPSVRRFDDYGAGANVAAARALFLGQQALTAAYGNGTDGKSRMIWAERDFDYGNQIAIAGGMICGVKKTRFKAKGSGAGTDYGVMAIDTAAAPVT